MLYISLTTTGTEIQGPAGGRAPNQNVPFENDYCVVTEKFAEKWGLWVCDNFLLREKLCTKIVWFPLISWILTLKRNPKIEKVENDVLSAVLN